MNIGNISDQLPTYPSNIQGELRVILQTKDIFLVCYKHLEEYRHLINEQNRLITKEFVQEQLQVGEDEITELNMEIQDAESKLGARLRHNELLAEQLTNMGFASLENGGSVRHMALVRAPQMRKNLIAQRKAVSDGGPCSQSSNRSTHMIDNISLAIDEIQKEVRTKVKPLLDYYRDLFYLQLHFSLILGQVCNYCMPLVTENIGLIDRIFFWSERPEFDLVRRSGDISDRLKEIYTRAQTILGVLAESVRFLQSKVELQKNLEIRFHERLDEQQKCKDKILRDIHNTKQNMDSLEEENDRLVGSLVKVDPTFVDSQNFIDLAEGGKLPAQRLKTPQNEVQNNANEDLYFDNSSNQFGQVNLERVQDIKRNRIAEEIMKINQSKDYNNNRPASNNCGLVENICKISDEEGNLDKSINKSQKSENFKKKVNKKKSSNNTLKGNTDRKIDNHKSMIQSNIKPRIINKRNGLEDRNVSPRMAKYRRSTTVTGREEFFLNNSSAEKNTKRRRSSSRNRLNSNMNNHGRSREPKGKSEILAIDERTLDKNALKSKDKSGGELTTNTARLTDTGTSLKSRLLGRTKGLIDAAKFKVRKNKSNNSDESEAYMELALPLRDISDYEGDFTLTSMSSLDSTIIPKSGRLNQNHIDDINCLSSSPEPHSLIMNNVQNHPNKNWTKIKGNVYNENKNMLHNTYGENLNETNSMDILQNDNAKNKAKTKHSTKSEIRSKSQLNSKTINQLADYLTNSTSQSIPFTDGSILPAL